MHETEANELVRGVLLIGIELGQEGGISMRKIFSSVAVAGVRLEIDLAIARLRGSRSERQGMLSVAAARRVDADSLSRQLRRWRKEPLVDAVRRAMEGVLERAEHSAEARVALVERVRTKLVGELSSRPRGSRT